jgi:hypothetical protein
MELILAAVMLVPVRLAEQFSHIERELGDDWSSAQLVLQIEGRESRDRAAALLGPINPGRRRDEIRISTARSGAGHRPDVVRRLLRRVDEEGTTGTLELVASEAEAAPQAAPDQVRPTPTLAAAWDAAVATLPPDWSDVHAEIELTSTDLLDRAALLLAPLNPTRVDSRPAFRFRVARSFGYGASAAMTRRCLERLDEAGIKGELSILRVLSDTKPVATQGPVWYVGGKPV